jgi:ABC-type uncharacterized transport system substrate-binding protein
MNEWSPSPESPEGITRFRMQVGIFDFIIHQRVDHIVRGVADALVSQGWVVVLTPEEVFCYTS